MSLESVFSRTLFLSLMRIRSIMPEGKCVENAEITIYGKRLYIHPISMMTQSKEEDEVYQKNIRNMKYSSMGSARNGTKMR